MDPQIKLTVKIWIIGDIFIDCILLCIIKGMLIALTGDSLL
jgi:hypothetical protein